MDREKELFEWVRGMYPEMRPEDKKDAERFFPALAESDDERNWKAVMGYVKDDTLRAWLEKQKKRGNLSKDKEYTLARIIEYLEDNDCPSEWKDLLYDVYSLPYQKEQKPAEKQDYSCLTDLERVILRGFLAAGVENVSVTIIKETAKECLAQMKPAEWSEEDEERLNITIGLFEKMARGDSVSAKETTCAEFIDWLKSLRPQPKWKPSEEQMKAMEEVRTIFHHHHLWDEINPILYDYEELMRDLKKLM